MNSNTLLHIDQKHVWHPFDVLHAQNILIEKAKDAILYSADGRKIIDAVSSWWVNIHGHANEQIAEAIAQQARKLEQVIFSGFTHPPAIQLADELLKVLPPSIDQIFYSDNGSTSVEVAIKLAIQYWSNQGIDKQTIVVLENSYHGDTFGAMSVSERSVFSKPFDAYLFDVLVLNIHSLSESELIQQFNQFIGRNKIAAFIYEPLVQGAGGMKIYSAQLLENLLLIAHQNQIITIADEVMTGFSRTGRLFASDYLQTKPDIMCLSKGITGGFLPLGVTAISKRIVYPFEGNDKFRRFYHGHSYTANPISCAAALASLKITKSNECRDNIMMIEKSHQDFAIKMYKNPKINSIKYLGTILSIELKTPESAGYFNNLRDFIYHFFLKKNILLRPLGNVVYIMPPYVINKEQLNQIYSAIEELLEQL